MCRQGLPETGEFTLDHFKFKAGYQAFSTPTEEAHGGNFRVLLIKPLNVPEESIIDPKLTLNLTDHHWEGNLVWNVPPGNWTICGSGMVRQALRTILLLLMVWDMNVTS